MPRDRVRRAWILAPIGLLLIGGTLSVVKLRGEPLHQNPQAIASVTHPEPAPRWSGAVAQTRRMIRSVLSKQSVPGLSVAVGVGSDIVWAEGFGWADIESRRPVSPGTRFRIGTASTVLTSAAASVLVEKGRLQLDKEVQAYVPQCPKKQWPVALRQLMAHVAGVGSDGGAEGPLFRRRCERPVDALQQFANSPLLFEPGTQYRHSKYGWILVSAAIEAASDQPFLAFTSEQIFQPLGMSNTGAESAKEENPERIGEPEEDPPFATFFRQVILKPLGIVDTPAKPATDPATIYVPGFGYDPQLRYGLHVMRRSNLSCYAGAMGFFSTPSDLVRFGLAINSGKLLRPDTVRSLQTPQRLASGGDSGHGLGWDIETVTLAGKPARAAGYDGELLGRRVVSFRMFRETGIVVAVMSNMAQADTPAMARNVADAFAQANSAASAIPK